VPVSDLFADERSQAEQTLVEIFRKLPPERQQGWLDLARTLVEDPTQRA